MAKLNILTEYAGARRTSEPIDRERTLNEIHKAIAGSGTHVLYIPGAGGLGKTYLLQAVLEWCRPGGDWHKENLLVADNLVDLYHTAHHTREGMVSALRDIIPAPDEAFETFDAAYQNWESSKFDLAGMLKEISKLREDVGEAFVEDLNTLAQDRRVIIALDTAERLLYEEDEVQQRLGLEPERVDTLDWLLEVLPRLENTVVLLAGRPKPERLRQDLRKALGDHLNVLELEHFELEDTKHYFDAVAQSVRKAGMDKEAQWIEAIPDQVREVIWHYTEGRPILLALTIDHLIVADELPRQVKDSLEKVRKLSEEELKKQREDLEAHLIRFWQDTGRQADQAIMALAWARKGMDAELLARVVQLKREDGSWDTEQAQEWLESIRELSFVKTRPADARFFLHDEMYDLLQRHVMRYLPEPHKERVHSAILDYYAEKISAQRKEVWRLSTPRERGVPRWDVMPTNQPYPPDRPEELARATNWLYNLMAEDVHYRLQQDPVDGFRTYQVYAKEAFWANSENLDGLLQSEILQFLDAHEGEDEISGLRRSEAEIAMALQRLERYNRARYAQAAKHAQDIRNKCTDLLKEAGLLSQVRLTLLEGEALTYIGNDFSQADKLLQKSSNDLATFEPETPLEQWQSPILLTEINNDLGYLYRTMGRFQKAVDFYGEAVETWRQLEDEEPDDLRRDALRAQHANTLNNQAWARAEIGDFEDALFDVRDALKMRKELGPQAPVAFSENTLGLILTRQGDPRVAQVHCRRALATFQNLEQPRGIGLASTALAEALRRDSGAELRYGPEESADLLRQAEQHTIEAVDIFSDQVTERPRLIEALIEQGCVYRQWAWLRPQYPSEKDRPAGELAQRSEAAFRKVIELAGEDLLYKGVDAQVNIAWLYYFIRQFDEAEEEANQAIDRIPDKYYITEDGGLPDPDLSHKFFWVQLGKAHLLLGEVGGSRYLDQELIDGLREMGKHYTLSLAYNELFAPDFRDLRRALQRIYTRLRKLNTKEFHEVHKGITEAVETCHLPEPTRLDKFLAKRHLPKRTEAA